MSTEIDDKEELKKLTDELGMEGASDSTILQELLKKEGLEGLTYGRIQEIFGVENKSTKQRVRSDIKTE